MNVVRAAHEDDSEVSTYRLSVREEIQQLSWRGTGTNIEVCGELTEDPVTYASTYQKSFMLVGTQTPDDLKCEIFPLCADCLVHFRRHRAKIRISGVRPGQTRSGVLAFGF